MKVYGTYQYFAIINGATTQVRAVVAAKNKTTAAAALGMSKYMFDQYAAETGNEQEIAKALERPGQVVVIRSA